MKTNEMQTEQPWIWCMTANVIGSHDYGKEKEMRFGTKHFSPGAKVYCLPLHYAERIKVIGKPRNTRRLIKVVMRMEHLENFRLEKVYKPEVLRLMKTEKFRWDDTIKSRRQIEAYVDMSMRAKYADHEGNHPNEQLNSGRSELKWWLGLKEKG